MLTVTKGAPCERNTMTPPTFKQLVTALAYLIAVWKHEVGAQKTQAETVADNVKAGVEKLNL